MTNFRHPFFFDPSTDVSARARASGGVGRRLIACRAQTVEYFRDKDQLVVSSAVVKCGSVKDRIYDIVRRGCDEWQRRRYR